MIRDAWEEGRAEGLAYVLATVAAFVLVIVALLALTVLAWGMGA